MTGMVLKRIFSQAAMICLSYFRNQYRDREDWQSTRECKRRTYKTETGNGFAGEKTYNYCHNTMYSGNHWFYPHTWKSYKWITCGHYSRNGNIAGRIPGYPYSLYGPWGLENVKTKSFNQETFGY